MFQHPHTMNPENNSIIFHAKCIDCPKKEDIEVSELAWKDYQSGKLIQEAFPELTDDQRELLISGVCGNCFDMMFG